MALDLTDKEWRSLLTCAHMLAKQPLSPPEDEIKDELLHHFWRGEFGSVRHPINLRDDCPKEDEEGQPYALLSPEDMRTAYRMYGGEQSIEALAQMRYCDLDEAYRAVYVNPMELNTRVVSEIMVEGKSPLPKLERPSSEQSKKEAERVCIDWLLECIKQNPEPHRAKGELRQIAMRKLPALSRRGFDRVWAKATKSTPEWSKPGPRSS